MFSFQPVIQLKSYLILSRFFRNCYHLIYLSRRPPGRCPVFHRALLSVVARAQPDKKSLPETSARLAFGCRPDAAGQKTLPEISTRLAFGCRSGAARQKIIARNLSAACFRLSLRRGQTKNHCPKSQRGLLSVIAPARPDKKSLPEISARHYLDAWICRGGRPGVARFFAAPCFRLSPGRGQAKDHCPKLHRCTGCAILSPLPVRQYFFLQGVEALFPL